MIKDYRSLAMKRSLQSIKVRPFSISEGIKCNYTGTEVASFPFPKHSKERI